MCEKYLLTALRNDVRVRMSLVYMESSMVTGVGPMKRVLITFAEKPTRLSGVEYPLAVVVVHENGKRDQDHLVRSVREGRLFANGLCTGAMYAPDHRDWPVNPEVDPRLVEE